MDEMEPNRELTQLSFVKGATYSNAVPSASLLPFHRCHRPLSNVAFQLILQYVNFNYLI
jgi:hypothetical protein